MVSEIFFALTFLGLIQSPQKVGDELDEATTARMQQHAEELQARMMQLLLEIEQREQEHGWAHVGTLLLSVLQHWQFWVLTGEIVLFFVLCCMLMKFCHERCSRTKKGVSGRKDDDSEEDPSDILDARRFVSEYLQRPVRNLGGTCKVVEELMNNLLATCQCLCLYPGRHQLCHPCLNDHCHPPPDLTTILVASTHSDDFGGCEAEGVTPCLPHAPELSTLPMEKMLLSWELLLHVISAAKPPLGEAHPMQLKTLLQGSLKQRLLFPPGQ